MKHQKKNELNLSKTEEVATVITDILGEKKDAKDKRYQMQVLSFGLLAYTILFLAINVIMDTVIYQGDGFE